jgi:hypothetical protein
LNGNVAGVKREDVAERGFSRSFRVFRWRFPAVEFPRTEMLQLSLYKESSKAGVGDSFNLKVFYSKSSKVAA